MDLGLKGKKVIVTGALHEFGRHLACCQELGGDQRVVDRNEVVVESMNDQRGDRDGGELCLVRGDQSFGLLARVQTESLNVQSLITNHGSSTGSGGVHPSCRCSTTTVVSIPPRVQNSAVSRAKRGEHADTMSSSMALVTAS